MMMIEVADLYVGGFLGVLVRILLGSIDDAIGQDQRDVLLRQVVLLVNRVGLFRVA